METWTSEQREFIKSNKVISKRQLTPSELLFNPSKILLPNERLKNEHAALCYVRENTTIPVPQIISFGYEKDSPKLVIGFIEGKLLEDFDDEQRHDVLRVVNEQMKRHIIPELHKLQRKTTGSIDGSLPVIPPNPVMYATKPSSWRHITTKGPAFVFCHNDLSGHNIILNPETYEIVGIVDWEYAGFFPHWFERELWKKRYTEREEEEERTFVKSAEEFFRDGV